MPWASKFVSKKVVQKSKNIPFPGDAIGKRRQNTRVAPGILIFLCEFLRTCGFGTCQNRQAHFQTLFNTFSVGSRGIFLVWIALFAACADIPRDNPLDPKNPESTRKQKVLIEAFVNTTDSLPVNVNKFALAALDSLQKAYPGELVILDYHRNTRDYSDPYHSIENENLYRHYIAHFDSFAGVPDVFFNGTLARVQGASGVQTSITRFSNALAGLLNRNSEFFIEIEYQRNGGEVVPEIKVARLGSSDASNLVLKTVLIAQIDQQFLKRVVRDVSAVFIQKIEHGSFRQFTLAPLLIKEPQAKHFLAAYVTDGAEEVVFQCEIEEVR